MSYSSVPFGRFWPLSPPASAPADASSHLPLRNAVQHLYAGAFRTTGAGADDDNATPPSRIVCQAWGKDLRLLFGHRAGFNLLSPVEEAAKACAEIRKPSTWVAVGGSWRDSGDLYRPAVPFAESGSGHPVAWSPELAYRFLRGVSGSPELERSGLSVRVPNWWRKRPRPQVSVTIGSQTPPRVGADAVLDFRVEVALGDLPLIHSGKGVKGQNVEDPPRRRGSAQPDRDLTCSASRCRRRSWNPRCAAPATAWCCYRNQWVEVDRERLGQAIAHWEALQRHADGDGISLGRVDLAGMRRAAGGRFGRSPAGGPDRGRPSLGAGVTAGAALRTLLDGLRRPGTLTQREPVGGGGRERRAGDRHCAGRCEGRLLSAPRGWPGCTS